MAVAADQDDEPERDQRPERPGKPLARRPTKLKQHRGDRQRDPADVEEVTVAHSGAESYPLERRRRQAACASATWRSASTSAGAASAPMPSAVRILASISAGDLGVLGQELLGVVAPLAEPGLAVGEEGARLLDDVVLDAEVEQLAFARDALAVLDLELGLAEGRGALVLDDFDPDPVADRLGAVLEGLDAADVEPLRGIELQRPAARLGLRRAELDADLFADLVGEDADRVGAVEVAGQLAHRLRHQPRLQADGRVADLAVQLGLRRQRRDRVDRDHVDRGGGDQAVGDLQRLLAVVGLGDQQLVGVDADRPRVDRVHRVLGVDEDADPALGLGLGDDVVDQRRLARGLRAEDLDDPAARHAADAERQVEGEGPGRDRFDRQRAVGAEAHQRALAEIALDLGHRGLERRVLRLGLLGRGVLQSRFLVCHLFHLTAARSRDSSTWASGV